MRMARSISRLQGQSAGDDLESKRRSKSSATNSQGGSRNRRQRITVRRFNDRWRIVRRLEQSTEIERGVLQLSFHAGDLCLRLDEAPDYSELAWRRIDSKKRRQAAILGVHGHE